VSSAQMARSGPIRPQLPPGPRLPRAVQTLQWLVGSPGVMDRCRARYGDVFTLDLVPRLVNGPGATRHGGRWVFLAHSDFVRQVFSADPALVRAGETNKFLLGLVGPSSILVLDEPRHMTERKLMLPAFHGERVQGYARLMCGIARAEVDRWPVGEPFALWPRMQAITLEVIVRTVFGVSEPARLERMQGLVRTMLNGMTSPRWLAVQAVRATLQRRGRIDRAGAVRLGSVRGLLGPVDDALLEEIGRRRALADLEGRDDILSLLIRARYDDGSAMGDAELRDELITLLIAGHESTATMLAWAFERLLRHPDKLERLRREVEAGGECYADAVVKETLRLRPVLSFVLRKLAEPMEVGGHRLPAGTWVAPCAYLIHRRADIYPEPLRFLPERFLDQPPGTYTWLPFGGGVRRCLGASFAQLEMREVLRTVVACAELRPATSGPERPRSRFITLAPARGARVVMTAPPQAAAPSAPPAGSTPGR
jgi:cytochrome P450